MTSGELMALCRAAGDGSLGKGYVPVISVNPQVLDKSRPVYVHECITVQNNDFDLLEDVPCDLEVRHTRRFVFEHNRTGRALNTEAESVQELVLQPWAEQ